MGILEWAYILEELIRSCYTSPDRTHRPAPLPRGAPPAVLITRQFFLDLLGVLKPDLSQASATRAYERWKRRSRDYGLERPDAYKPAFPSHEFFSIDVLGAFDAIWAILGPPHPLEAAPIGGRDVGQSREVELLEAGQERFGEGSEPLPVEHELSESDWENEWRTHMGYWSGQRSPPRAGLPHRAARHYAIFPSVQERLRAAESYVDPELLVSTLPPVLTEEERQEAFLQAKLEGLKRAGPQHEDDEDIEWLGEDRPRRKRRKRRSTFASEGILLKLDELESHPRVDADLIAKRLGVTTGGLSRIRSRSLPVSIVREQKIHDLYGEVFGGPVPRLKGPRRRKAPTPARAIRALIEAFGHKGTAERLLRKAGRPVSKESVQSYLSNSIYAWDGRNRKGERIKRRKMSAAAQRLVLSVYNDAIAHVEIPEPETWRKALDYILARVSDPFLAFHLGVGVHDPHDWRRGRSTPSVEIQARLERMAEEVRPLPAAPPKQRKRLTREMALARKKVKKAIKPERALRILVDRYGSKGLAKHMLRLEKKELTRDTVRLKRDQIQKWDGRAADGSKIPSRKISERKGHQILQLYNELMLRKPAVPVLDIPVAPKRPWQENLAFVLDRLSQNRLSKKIGSSRGTIHNWIKGTHPPSIPMQAKLAEVAEEVKGWQADPKKGMRPGKPARAPFLAPVSTPPYVSRALEIIYHAFPGRVGPAKALGVNPETWKVWATGKLKRGERRWVPPERWAQILELANGIDPAFPLPDPEFLLRRARVNEEITYLFERAGKERAADLLGMPLDSVFQIMSDPDLPPPDVAKWIHQVASRSFTAGELGREGIYEERRGRPAPKVADVVEGWRDMLTWLIPRFRSRRALSLALREHGSGASAAVIKKFEQEGDAMIRHKGQLAIEALYASMQGAPA
jgi:transcriptional regulator with XRE-family HTH domain